MEILHVIKHNKKLNKDKKQLAFCSLHSLILANNFLPVNWALGPSTSGETMNIIAFAASNSSKSINKKLATYASTLLANASVEVIDLNDHELPLFSEDKESEMGKPDLAELFLKKIKNCDALIISFAEHNGTYSVAYKNLFDWCSRINPKVYQGKSMILLSTSPGPSGASTVLSSAVGSMPYFDGIVKGSFSLPSFYDNFDIENNKVSNPEICSQLKEVINKLNEK